jgi:hypothetical protein
VRFAILPLVRLRRCAIWAHLLNEYAVVAEVQSVQRPTFQIAAETTGDGAEVQLQKPDKFHLIGRCTGLLNLEATKK